MVEETNHFTVSYLRNLFKDYYKNHPVTSTIEIQTREVGIGEYGKKISSRHLSFRNNDFLNKYLQEKVPFFVSYSIGYYKFPDRKPMDNKELYAADLIYEFDADDFNLPCRNEHDVWICKNCKSHGTGVINFCPECNGKTEIIKWVCDKCLEHAKKETLRLMELFEQDFKISPKDFVISFSGGRGYHLRITDKSIISLPKSSRFQITNYVQGTNINLQQLGFEYKDKQWYCPNTSVKGFSSKILVFLKEYITNLTIESLQSDFNLTKQKALKILSNKDVILNKMDNNILWHGFSKEPKSDAYFWEALLNLAISKIGFKIDPSSSGDIYKIMRMPDTIHGGTGLLSNFIKTIDDLKAFDPLQDAVIFDKNNIKEVEITKPINKFKFLNQSYKSFEIGEKVEFPEPLSVYLLLKGVAK